MLLASALAVLCGSKLHAFEPVNYLLLPGSTLADECLLCERPTIPEPMRGSFRLRATGTDPLFTHYAVEDLRFVAGRDGAVTYRGSGSGTYEIGGEVALRQQMFLDLIVSTATETNRVPATNDVSEVTVAWPKLDIGLTQTNGTFVHTLAFHLVAEPVVEIPWHAEAGTAAGTVTFVWPASFGAATLLRAARPEVEADWQELTVKVEQAGDEFRATLPAADATGFFRLRTQ
jgi:hypothetical protein